MMKLLWKKHRVHAWRSLLASSALLASAHPTLAQGYVQTNLVTDNQAAAPAAKTDPNLVNPWGIAINPTGGAFWTSNNGSGKSGLYTGDVHGSQTNVVTGLAPVIPPATTGQIGTPT